MTAESEPEPEADLLELELESSHLPVSYVSSALRAIQAALREVARTNEAARPQFEQQPQPVLLLSRVTANGGVTLGFEFSNQLDSTRMQDLSSITFEAFLDEFTQFVRGLPQRGLWGDTLGGSPRKRYDSEMTRRLDQLRIELRRFVKSRLSFRGRTILFEGDRMVLG